MSLSFQWLQELKEKKSKPKAAQAALGVRKSPRSHSVKVFYMESTASEERTTTGSPKKAKLHWQPKTAKLASPPEKAKLGSPPKETKGTILYRLN